jgi:hypothetical protein
VLFLLNKSTNAAITTMKHKPDVQELISFLAKQNSKDKELPVLNFGLHLEIAAKLYQHSKKTQGPKNEKAFAIGNLYSI